MGPALTVTARRADSNVILNFILKEGNVKMGKRFSTFLTEKTIVDQHSEKEKRVERLVEMWNGIHITIATR